MAIKYKATKKVDKNSGTAKERYYATPVGRLNNSAGNIDLIKLLTNETSIAAQDILTVLELLPSAIETVLSAGKNVTIKGLGHFSTAITSEGVDTAEELTPDKVILSRIAFRADQGLTKRLKKTEFEKID